MSTICFLTESFSTTRLFEPIALALRGMGSDMHVRLCDVSAACNVNGEFLSESGDVFLRHGFDVVHIHAGTPNTRDYYRDQLRRMFADNVNVIVVPHELRGWTADAIDVAKDMGISSCHVQHGIFGPTFIGDVLPEETRRHIEQLSDKAGMAADAPNIRESDFCRGADWKAVAGPYFERRLLEMGIPQSQIGVTGYVRTDALYHSPFRTYEELCTQFSMDPTREKLVAFFWAPVDQYPGIYTQRYDQYDALLRAYEEIAKHWSNVNFVLLAHPKTDIAHMEEQVRMRNMDSIHIRRADGYHRAFYEHADLVIGVQSSCLVEAMLYACPILKMNFVLDGDRTPMLIEGSSVINVEHVRHLGDQLHRICTDKGFLERTKENQRYVAHDLMYAFDGNCARRVAEGLMRLAKGG